MKKKSGRVKQFFHWIEKLCLGLSYKWYIIISLFLCFLVYKIIDLLSLAYDYLLKVHFLGTCTILGVFIVLGVFKFCKTKGHNSDSVPDNQSSILSDEPINSQQEDYLNRINFVERLEDIIVKLPNEQSFRICIDAEWGEGKTSVFKLLKEELKEQKNIKYIDFDPWYYNGVKTGLKGLLKLLSHTISNQPPYPNANSDIDKLAKVILGGIGNKFLGISFEWLFRDKDIKKSLESISDSVKKTKKKYVIFIDDLDRLDASVIKNVLKIVMVLSEIKNLVFVIAASTEHICHNKEIISKEYIEKIMTLILPLPILNQVQIREYFYKEFYEIIKCENCTQEEKEEIKKRLTSSLFLQKRIFNLRDIKRMLSTFRILYKSLEKEVNVVDFVLIVYLFLFFPDMVKLIYDSKPKLVFTDSEDRVEMLRAVKYYVVENLFKSPPDKKDILKKLIEPYPQQDKEILEPILFEMFDSHDYFKGIADGKYFYKYFCFFIDKEEIPGKLIEQSIREWKGNENPEDDILETFKEWNSRGYDISNFFEKLTDKHDASSKKEDREIGIKRSGVSLSYADMAGEELLKKIIEVTDKIKEPILLTLRVDSFVNFIINNFCDDEEFLKDFIEKAENLGCCYILAIRLNKRNEYYTNLLFERLRELTPEQILNSGNWWSPGSVDCTYVMTSEFIKWREKISETGKNDSVEIYKEEYLSIILVNKRLILNWMRSPLNFWSGDLGLLWGENNVKKAISFLEKQELTQEEKLILDDFKKRE